MIRGPAQRSDFMQALGLSISVAVAAIIASTTPIIASATPTIASAQPAAPSFQRAAPIAAPDGRWDYASWDAAHQRLLVAHGQDVLVIDPSGNAPVRAIGTIAGAHAVLAIPGGNTVLVTSGHDDSVRILDETTGAELAKIAVAADPDAAVLSADGRSAYVMGAKAGAISIIDLVRRAETGRIALKPALEFAVLAGPTLLAVNNEELNEIELADLTTGKSAGTIALPGCTGPTGLAYAPEAGLALSSCANGQAALVDIAARRMIRLVPIGMGPDAAIWQAVRNRFLVPCGRSGTVAIITVNGRLAQAQSAVATEMSARTAALDPASGRLYLPAARFQPATTGQRPAMVPGSFHVVVLNPGA